MGRQSQRLPKGKVAPAPPEAPPVALMSDHLQRAGGRSGVAWPSATIPARVKKLSWDDGDQVQIVTIWNRPLRNVHISDYFKTLYGQINNWLPILIQVAIK